MHIHVLHTECCKILVYTRVIARMARVLARYVFSLSAPSCRCLWHADQKKKKKKKTKKRFLSLDRNVNGGNARVSSANRAKHIITEFPGLNAKNRKLRLIHQVTLSL